jgi:hypothetical protein
MPDRPSQFVRRLWVRGVGLGWRQEEGGVQIEWNASTPFETFKSQLSAFMSFLRLLTPCT